MPDSVLGGGSAAMNVTSVAFANFRGVNASAMANSKPQCHVTECRAGKRCTLQLS